jgi:hypothetical protein
MMNAYAHAISQYIRHPEHGVVGLGVRD